MTDAIGLVLEGGGVKGAYQAGALKAIGERGGKFDAVAGTSIGAVNGALFVQGGYAYVSEMWQSEDLVDIFALDAQAIEKLRAHEADPETLLYIGKRMIRLRQYLSQMGKRAEAFLRSYLDEELLRSSALDLGLVAYDVSDRKGLELMREDIPEGQLIDFVVASATYPAFPPKVIAGKRYIDGGVYDNMPVNLLASKEYRRQLIIRTNVATKRPKRAVEYEDLDTYYIIPQNDLGHAMSFTAEKVREFYDLGYADGLEALESGLAEFLGI